VTFWRKADPDREAELERRVLSLLGTEHRNDRRGGIASTVVMAPRISAFPGSLSGKVRVKEVERAADRLRQQGLVEVSDDGVVKLVKLTRRGLELEARRYEAEGEAARRELDGDREHD
jgi:hypothetical protein